MQDRGIIFLNLLKNILSFVPPSHSFCNWFEEVLDVYFNTKKNVEKRSLPSENLEWVLSLFSLENVVHELSALPNKKISAWEILHEWKGLKQNTLHWTQNFLNLFPKNLSVHFDAFNSNIIHAFDTPSNYRTLRSFKKRKHVANNLLTLENWCKTELKTLGWLYTSFFFLHYCKPSADRITFHEVPNQAYF